MLLETLSGPLRKALAANSALSSFPARLATGTRPTGVGVFDLGGEAGGACADQILVMPYGVGSDNDTFSLRVGVWHRVGAGATALWVYSLLAELLCTLSSSAPGVAGKEVVATEYFADTIAIVGTSGVAGQGVRVTSPAQNLPAFAVVDGVGGMLLDLSFTTGGVATSANALWRHF